MLLVDLIEANPKTKFILFHGGFPWVGETGVIFMKHGNHVWAGLSLDSDLSYATAKRAFHAWLDVFPSTGSCGGPTPTTPREFTAPPR